MKKVLKNLMLVMVMTLLCMAVAVTADAACDHEWRVADIFINGERCDSGGEIHLMCKLCGYVEYRTIEPGTQCNLSGYPTDEELSAFCDTRDFWVECEYCSYGESVSLYGTGQHNWNGTPSNSGFNCTLGGNWDYYCSDCGRSKTEYVEPKPDHEWENYPDISTFCGERYFFLNCKNCDETNVEVYITGTAEHNWCRHVEDFNCLNGGYIEYVCHECETERYEAVAPKAEHEYELPSNERLESFCGKEQLWIYCKNCSDEVLLWYIGTKEHDYNTKWTVLTTATCTYPGISVRACYHCADIESQTTPAYGHFDNDEDGKCDECKVIIEIYAPNDPSIPADPPVYPGDPDDTHTEHTYGEWTEKDNIMYRVCTGCGNVETKEIESTPEDPSKDCSCNCHKTGIMGIIWKILRFFYKLFRINPVCACGIAHY